MTPSQQAPSLVERLKSSAEAFRRYPVYTVDGDAVKLTAQADEADEAAARITELEGDLKAALREISKLAREAGEAKGRLEMSEAAGIVDGWRERAERAEARCRVLEEALRPFAEACAHLHPSQPDDGVTLDGFEVRDFRCAAHAFSLPDSPSADAGSHPRLADQAHASWNRRPDGARGGEPAAWRVDFQDESACLVFTRDDADEVIADALPGATASPLYASPAEPSGWRPIDQAPDLGRKIVALFGDGSGASMFWRHDGGHIDAYGDEWGELHDHYALWTYLPDSFQFWCEYRSDEPMTLTLPPTSEGGGA